jgi:hypothetical protein
MASIEKRPTAPGPVAGAMSDHLNFAIFDHGSSPDKGDADRFLDGLRVDLARGLYFDPAAVACSVVRNRRPSECARERNGGDGRSHRNLNCG